MIEFVTAVVRPTARELKRIDRSPLVQRQPWNDRYAVARVH